jgi:hypothetical protein
MRPYLENTQQQQQKKQGWRSGSNGKEPAYQV